MILKLVAIVTLLCYINTTTYIPKCLKASFLKTSSESSASFVELAGSDVTALIPIILTEITEAPIEKSRGFRGIFYDYYNLLLILLVGLAVKIFQIFFNSFPRSIDVGSFLKYASSKVICLLGYYTFLFRLKPF